MDFLGNYTHRMDAKGRVSIPSKFRKVLDEKYECQKLFVTVLDNALCLYPLAEWEKIKTERLSAIDTTTPEGRRKVRQFASNAEEIEVDSQGRILLSGALQSKAGVGQGELVLAGNLNCFEIWSPRRWDEYWGKEEG